MDKLTEIDLEIIRAMADHDMNVSLAARSRFTHRNNVLYHIRKIKKITGLSATNFYDLCKLVQMIRKEDFSWINSPKMPKRQERPE